MTTAVRGRGSTNACSSTTFDPRDSLRVGHLAGRQHADERLALVRLGERRHEGVVVVPSDAFDVAGRQHPADRGHEMRHEGDAGRPRRSRARARAPSRACAGAREPVRADALLGRHVTSPHRSPARPAPDSPVLPSTTIGPGDQSALESSGASPRTTGVGKHPGFATSCAPGSWSRNRSGRPYTALSEPRGRRMLEPVPLRIRDCGQPEVPGQIDHARPTSRSRRRELRALSVRQRERTRRRPPRAMSATTSSFRRSSAGPSWARLGWTSPSVFPTDPCAPRNVTLGGRMVVEQPDQLAPGEPGRAEHGDADVRGSRS